jgi:DNA invertase Pin-like site-specific DNA recombinase
MEREMKVGYARVSTNGQDLASQREALTAAGCEKVFAEKISGARGDRPQLARMLKALGPGDVIIVTRLDRLARSTRDLLNILDTVGKAGAGFKSIADPMIDTTSPHGKLILAVLAALSEFERSMILARTSDGRSRAKAKGVRFGRKPILTAHQRKEAFQRLANGEAQADVARSFNVSQATISRLSGGSSVPFAVENGASPAGAGKRAGRPSDADMARRWLAVADRLNPGGRKARVRAPGLDCGASGAASTGRFPHLGKPQFRHH